jgi:ribosome-associated toxin RatA of RatAB toxin-antitoxin module
MTTHEFTLDMPHSAARVWALFQDYDRWADYAPMVHRVDVLRAGDEDHNGRLRRVFYKLPGDQTGTALELVTAQLNTTAAVGSDSASAEFDRHAGGLFL